MGFYILNHSNQHAQYPDIVTDENESSQKTNKIYIEQRRMLLCVCVCDKFCRYRL